MSLENDLSLILTIRFSRCALSFPQLLATLSTPQTKVGATVAQSISAIAQSELPHNLWPSLVPSLLQNATNAAGTPHLKQNTLECIGFICEEIVCQCCMLGSLEVLWVRWGLISLLILKIGPGGTDDVRERNSHIHCERHEERGAKV